MVTVASVWALLLVVTSIVLCALPLFGLLGYESSFVLAIVVSLAAAQVAGAAVAPRREEIRTGREENAERPLRLVLSLWARSALLSLSLLVLPLAVLLANALRVKNCALLEGVAWFALLPGLSALFGAAAGTAAGLSTRTRAGGALLGTALVLGSLLFGLRRFYAAPPVFAYDPFAGFFSGSLYDEAITIEPALLAARGLHLVGLCATLLGLGAMTDPGRVRISWRWALRLSGRTAAALAALLLFLSLHRAARPLLAPTAADIAEALGGRRDTEHLTILYARGGAAARTMDFFARDAEFRYRQLVTALGGPPAGDGRVTVFLFESADEKRRWLGAAHVQVAKPWRREVYVQWDALPHPVLAHELAHVFAGRFGDSIFGVARRGLAFNVGLIEGVAVAAGEHPVAGAPLLDHQVKAMRDLGLEPGFDAVFGLGFLGEAPARAYTVAGSFIRFLLEQRGPGPLAEVYRAAGTPASWQAAYGQPLAELRAAWSRRIDATPITDRERTVIGERMRRPSILHRVCAHRLAEERAEARRRSARGDHEAALALLDSICVDDPDDPDPLLAVMDERAAAGDEAGATATAERVLAHPKASDGQRARALLFHGDTALRAALGTAAPEAAPGWTAAGDRYRRAVALRLDDDSLRQLRARLLVFDPPSPGSAPLGPPLARYLVGDGPQRDPALDLWRAQLLADAWPSSGLGRYLLGRMLQGRDRFADAIIAYDEALRLGLPEGGFLLVARRNAAVCAFRAGDLAGARARFEALARDLETTDPGAAGEFADWVARTDDFLGHPR